MLPAVDEGNEARRVQAALSSAPPVPLRGLQPRLLEAEPDRRPPAGVGLEQQADEVSGGLADAVEEIGTAHV